MDVTPRFEISTTNNKKEPSLNDSSEELLHVNITRNDAEKRENISSSLLIDESTKHQIINELRSNKQNDKMKLPNFINVIQITTREEAEKQSLSLHLHCKNQLLQNNINPHVGVDAEWKPNVKGSAPNPISLLQIATNDKVFLFHLYEIKMALRIKNHHHNNNDEENENVDSPLPLNALKKFLEDEKIQKVGVGIRADSKKLLHDYGLKLNGCVELASLVDSTVGLKSLCERYFGLRLGKDRNIQCSDWSVSASEYTDAQIEYAALDAFASYLLFRFIYSDASFLLSRKKHRSSIDVNVKANDCNNDNYDDNKNGIIVDRRDHNGDDIKVRREGDNASKKVEMRKNKKKKQEYRSKSANGCKMIAPDGTLLTYCSFEKVQWYVQRGLGEIIYEDNEDESINHLTTNSTAATTTPSTTTITTTSSTLQMSDNHQLSHSSSYNNDSAHHDKIINNTKNDKIIYDHHHNRNQPSIRLNFTPSWKKGSSLSANWGMREVPWTNQCVRCGTNQQLSKYHIVPQLYRQYLPTNFKHQCTHDVLLLCRSCHSHCSYHQEIYIKRLAEEKSIPILGIGNQSCCDHSVAKVRSCARSLLSPPSFSHRHHRHNEDCNNSDSNNCYNNNKTNNNNIFHNDDVNNENKKNDNINNNIKELYRNDISDLNHHLHIKNNDDDNGDDDDKYRVQLNRWRKNHDRLQVIVAEYLGVDLSLRTPPILSVDELKFVASLKVAIKNDNYIPHGAAMIATLVSNEDIQRFLVGFRKVFALHDLKFLPSSWDIQHDWNEHHGTGVRSTPFF